MDTGSLFAVALNLPQPWCISQVEFKSTEDASMELHIHIAFLKGSHIQSNTVVAAGSLITQAFMRENVIIGGVPAKILRYDIDWHP